MQLICSVNGDRSQRAKIILKMVITTDHHVHSLTVPEKEVVTSRDPFKIFWAPIHIGLSEMAEAKGVKFCIGYKRLHQVMQNG